MERAENGKVWHRGRQGRAGNRGEKRKLVSRNYSVAFI